MRWTGVIVLLFIAYHLADLTLRVGQPGPSPARAVYEKVVASFSNPAVAAFYLVANLALGVHLYHGGWSLFQSMGWNNRRFNHWRRAFAIGFAVDRGRAATSRSRIAVQFGIVGLTPTSAAPPRARTGSDTMLLDSKIPDGPLESMWDDHKFSMKLVNPNNKRKFEVIVVGTGLAGASAAATMGELGYKVKVFTFHDSPRRAHSIAAQGGINAAKNYHGDGDSVYRLFYDTVKGGDYRAREANVYRLAQVSNEIIDQCTAQGVPFAREYGGMLANRSFGGAQVSRTFYARGQTGQQLLLGAYQALARQVKAGTVELHTRSDMLELVTVDGKSRPASSSATSSPARSARTRRTPWCSRPAATRTSSTCRPTRWPATRPPRGGRTARARCSPTPAYTQIHPTAIPSSDEFQSKLTLMSESLRNDGRIWVPKDPDEKRAAARHPRGGPRLLPRAQATRPSATSSPRDVSSRARQGRSRRGPRASGR